VQFMVDDDVEVVFDSTCLADMYNRESQRPVSFFVQNSNTSIIKLRNSAISLDCGVGVRRRPLRATRG
jgi:hypothetical protein